MIRSSVSLSSSLGLRAIRSTANRVAVRAMAAAGTPQTSFHILHYEYVSDILEKRGPHREAHLAAARKQAESGKIFLAGAVADPVDSAIFVWKDATKDEIAAFVKDDPYVKAGLVPKWSIRPYMVVVGGQ
ncbi:hypothetical protein WJX72_011037 [[Myrmecia] bisecta]|uniref:YCII-related domain-containing protein n=1 Tax=[Myrmecia] bisecta TaxID=41462 RepID=A0AAW1Q4T1_9CHLO